MLALVRDIGAGNVVAPIMEELRRRGHTTLLLAEEDGRARYGLTGPFTIINKEMLDARFAGHAPDVVITGLSTPRVLEHTLDVLAKRAGIPLVQVEDYWGCHVRSRHTADLYVTIDTAAERLLQRSRPSAGSVIAGFAGIAPVAVRPELAEVLAVIRRERKTKILVYPDGGPECERALPMLVDSILQTPGLFLVPKFHPKMDQVTHPEGGTWGQWCRAVLHPLRNCGRVIELAAPTDEVVEAADGVVSGYSTTLIRAAAAGKVALTLWDDIIRKELTCATGLDKTPLMLDGRFPVLKHAMSLDSLLQERQPVLDIKPFDARIAADAIVRLTAR